MAVSYKVLGQVNPAAATATTLYTASTGGGAVISTLAICNINTSATVRVAIRPAGATLDPKHYILYEQGVSANDSLFLTLGMAIEDTTVVTVYASSANVSFSLFGSEIS